MFVKVGDRVTVEDLIRGIVVQSGNDATIVVAEGIGGSEGAFADLMTEKARAIGMANSTFRNASGWPGSRPRHHGARPGRPWPSGRFGISRSTIGITRKNILNNNNIKQGNRNPLLYKDMGADGLKTGHTQASGYGLTASAERNGRRLIVVANGFESVKARAAGSERLIDWGFRTWNNYALFEAGSKVADAPVWLGEADNVPIVIKDKLVITIPRKSRSKMKVVVGLRRAHTGADQERRAYRHLDRVRARCPKAGSTALCGRGRAAARAGRTAGRSLRYLVWGGKFEMAGTFVTSKAVRGPASRATFECWSTLGSRGKDRRRHARTRRLERRGRNTETARRRRRRPLGPGL